MRATEGYPKVSRSIQIAGYNQLIQEVAERIADGRIAVPEELRRDYADIYNEGKPTWPEYYGAQALMFSELRKPDVKKKALNLHRRTYDEKDIQEFIKDRKFLAALDAYIRGGVITFGRMKEIQFGDLNANPRDLSFDAFAELILALVPRIQAGEISLPLGLEEEFPYIYHPPPVEPQ
jgi:hypothetical protein